MGAFIIRRLAWAVFVTFVITVLVLRPTGLFGSPYIEKV